MTRKLIVSADDLGLHEAINRGVLEAHEDGIVTCASIVPCGRAFEHACRLVEKRRKLGLGIHLTLVGERPLVHHVDVILGEILGPAPHRDTLHHPTARVVQTWRADQARRRDGWLEFRYRIAGLRDSVFLRARGTNTDVVAPRLDPLKLDPWRDLWFYCNPVMLRLRPG